MERDKQSSACEVAVQIAVAKQMKKLKYFPAKKMGQALSSDATTSPRFF